MRKPFFWKQRKCWYVRSEDGRTNVRLDPDEQRAFDVWNELRTAAHPESPAATFAVIAENYSIQAEKTLGPKQYRAHRDYLVGACTEFGMVRVVDLKKHHVLRWLDAKPTWGDCGLLPQTCSSGYESLTANAWRRTFYEEAKTTFP